MRYLRNAALLEKNNAGVTLDCADGVVCHLHVLSDRIFRVTFIEDGVLRVPRTYSVLPSLSINEHIGDSLGSTRAAEPSDNKPGTR